jgi:AAA+ superfamily predicted ATPase
VLPTEDKIRAVLRAKVAGIKTATRLQLAKLGVRAKGLSYADITRAAEDALKHAIIEGRSLSQTDLSDALAERRAALNHGRPKHK